ncbi:hypothetical protein [Peribacillus sp. SCS-155]|uniref:hypothetical protein n=1 Tax=Peribacillus sedimenti TaxID=3115297 RepID=UPI003905C783
MDNLQEVLRSSFDDLDLIIEGGESNRPGMARAAQFLDDVKSLPKSILVAGTHGNLLTLLLKLLDDSHGLRTIDGDDQS